jgi:hypothetical protein
MTSKDQHVNQIEAMIHNQFFVVPRRLVANLLTYLFKRKPSCNRSKTATSSSSREIQPALILSFRFSLGRKNYGGDHGRPENKGLGAANQPFVALHFFHDVSRAAGPK